MIAIIRISGAVKLDHKIKETFERLGLKRKYSCVVFNELNEIEKGMLLKVKDHVAYGDLEEETFKKLLEVRGSKEDKTKTKKKYLFRLHPPRKGIDSKKHFGVNKGVLGNNKEEINKLIERML